MTSCLDIEKPLLPRWVGEVFCIGSNIFRSGGGRFAEVIAEPHARNSTNTPQAAATERMLTADQPCCRISSRLAFSISSLDVTTVFIQHLNMNNVQYRYTEFFPLSTGKKRQKAALTSGVIFVIIGRESRKAFQIFTYRR